MTAFWRNIAVVVGFVAFLNLFLFHNLGAGAVAILLIASFIFFFSLYFKSSEANTHRWPSIGIGVFLLVQISALLFRGFWLAQALATVTSLVALSTLVYLLTTSIPIFRSLLEALLAPLNLGISYLEGLTRLPGMFKGESEHFKSNTHRVWAWSKRLILGLVIAIPILFILIGLLSADPVFAKFIQKIFNFTIPARLETRVIFTVLFLGILTPLTVLKRKHIFESPTAFLYRSSYVYEMAVVMALVAITLGTFLIIQWPYVFVNVPFETDLSKFGVATYSEYVKKGFGEFMVAAAFLYGLVWLGLISLRGKKADQKNILLPIQMVIFAEFALFLFSIFRRIWLYQSFHGLSLVRVYGAVFLVWVCVITLFLALRHFWQKKWVLYELGITVAFLLFISLFNAESFIVEFHPPTVNKRLDYVYLSRMSADGYDGWKKAYEEVNNILANPTFPAKAKYFVAQEPGAISPMPFTADDRRQIAYAGIALERLMHHYHELVTTYGSDAEKRAYYGMLHRYALTHIETILQSPTFTRPDSDFFAEAARQNRLRIRASLEEKHTQLYANLQEILKPADTSDFHIQYNPLTRWSSQKVKFDQENCMFWGICSSYPVSYIPSSFFDIFSKESKQPYTKPLLDQLFTLHIGRPAVFEQMKEEMPFENLLKMQEVYFTYFEGIAIDYTKNYDYEADISLDTPFLESF